MPSVVVDLAFVFGVVVTGKKRGGNAVGRCRSGFLFFGIVATDKKRGECRRSLSI